MPVRDFARDRVWLFPPSLDELIEPGHPVRYVATFIDSLPRSRWLSLGINIDGTVRGRASYSARALLGILVYGFMTRVTVMRDMERACKENVCFMWIAGQERPDHNTIWRFYTLHRDGLQDLLRDTVQTAVREGQVALAVQALDGTKIRANASRHRSRTWLGLSDLLTKTNEQIARMEAENRAEHPETPIRPTKAQKKLKRKRERIVAAMTRLGPPKPAATKAPRTEQAPPATEAGGGNAKGNGKRKAVKPSRGPRINLTDFDAKIHKGKHGEYYPGYNAQAVVTPLVDGPDGEEGVLIIATDVSQDANDLHQLTPMLKRSEEMTQVRIPLTLTDSGYHSGANLAEVAARGQSVYMPDPKAEQLNEPYGKARFVYEPETDTYRCPMGKTLHRQMHEVDRPEGKLSAIRYRASKPVCDACPASALCREGVGNGRSVTVTVDEPLLIGHRRMMEDETVQAVFAKRKEWSEPTFGTLKAVLGADHFHLRGLQRVTAEWRLLATAFNLRTLAARWRKKRQAERRLAWLAAV